jgi:polyhydroxyalkanoate synthesis regulator phasin
MGSSSQTVSGQKVSPLSDLVENGTITSDQEQAIKDALDKARMAFQTQAGSAGASGNLTFTDPLDSLVTTGTITEDQKTAVKSALQSKKPQGMPPPPPPPMQQDNSSDPLSSILDNLVKKGTITSDQEQTIQSAYQSAIKAYSAQACSLEDLLTDSSYTQGI